MRFDTTIDGQDASGDLPPRVLLADWLRQIGKTGVQIGCDTSACGACTVLLDGDPVKSCTMFAVQTEGREVLTIHGLTPETGLSTIQSAFAAEHGTQCGFCAPGFIASATALLNANPSPDRSQIIEALEGNLCRCTGYVPIIRAVQHAAALLRGETVEPVAGAAHEHPIA